MSLKTMFPSVVSSFSLPDQVSSIVNTPIVILLFKAKYPANIKIAS